MSTKQKINLIWQTTEGDETSFELEYITNVLFELFEQTKIFDNGRLETVIDNSVIIYSNNKNNCDDKFIEYLNKFTQSGYDFYLLHLSNESLNHNFNYYTLANHCFRNYYDKNIKLNNCTFIPLGFKSNFLNREKSYENIKEKIYDFAFIGQIKSDREILVNILETLDNVFIHKTTRWNCHTALSELDCSNIYSQTKFIPCPMGYEHPDSFRIMEALESGSIPIIMNYNNFDYFDNVWDSNSPIPRINNWDEIINYKNMTKIEYNTLYHKVFDWYRSYKVTLQNKLLNTILTNEK